MDHDRLALFLAGYTTGGFRRSLQIAPQATLTKCGFNAAEAAMIAASLSKHAPKQRNQHDLMEIQFAFQKITGTYSSGGKSASDDWASRC